MTRTLLTLCSSLALASCGPQEKINVGTPPPPGEWLVCEGLPLSPDLKPLKPYRLADGRMVYLKSEVDARDAQIAPYVVALRGAWFSCSNNVGRVRDYHNPAPKQ